MMVSPEFHLRAGAADAVERFPYMAIVHVRTSSGSRPSS